MLYTVKKCLKKKFILEYVLQCFVGLIHVLKAKFSTHGCFLMSCVVLFQPFLSRLVLPPFPSRLVAFLYTVILTMFRPGRERLFPGLIKDWQFTVSPTTDWHFRYRGFKSPGDTPASPIQIQKKIVCSIVNHPFLGAPITMEPTYTDPQIRSLIRH